MVSQDNRFRTERELIGKRVQSYYEYLKDKFDQECEYYLKAYRHEFTGLLPERLLKSDRADVNVVYPIVKTLIPNLYFQDPKVWVKALQEKISNPVMLINEETGEEEQFINPETGEPQFEEYDAVRSALIFQNALNSNIDKAKLKGQVKSSILDAHLTYYGAIKCGWGNDQGVESMGAGAPPSVREDIFDNIAYGIRMKPWHVIPDLSDFYNPSFVALRYVVDPEYLQNDVRLNFRDEIKGQTELTQEEKERMYKYVPLEDTKKTVYYEVFFKPSAKYPKGKFYIFTDEVKQGFLYESEWPYAAKEFPVKLLYFNPDPRGGLPIPDVRYYIQQQKVKLNIRNAEYEYIQRTMPIMGVDLTGVKNDETVKKQIESGQIPRVVSTNRNPDRVLSGVSFPSLNIDFTRFDVNVDNDISRVVGMVAPINPISNSDNQLATALKLQDKGEQIRQNERADIVSDFITSIVEFWAKLYQEFAGPENYTEIDGEKFPVKWSRDEINGMFKFKIKPFSMSYEDPVIRRRQWADLLNLLGSPEIRSALAEQGVQVDIAKIVKRILETFDERDVENFIIDDFAKPEVQAMIALEENEAIVSGQPAQVKPTDNHKLHMLLHGLLGDAGLEHMEAHNQAIATSLQSNSTGGGNVESSTPVNGVATDQEQFREPLKPNAKNKETAINREATKIR